MAIQDIHIGSVTDLRPGQMKRVEINGHGLLLANVDGDYLVTDDMCTHEDASLTTGCLRGDLIKCPLHGSRFSLRTGEALDEPAEDPLRTYTVSIRGTELFITY